MNKKKVLIDIYYLHVAQTGIKTYAETLYQQALADKGDDFEFIISPDPEKIRKSKFFKGKTPKWKNLLFQAQYFLRKQLVLPFLSYRHKADVVFCPDIMIPLWGRGKRVSVIHDAFFWESPEHYHPLWLKYYLTFLKIGLGEKGRVITITDFSKSRLHKHLGSNIQIDVAWPSSSLPSLLEKSQLPDLVGSPYFLHVGVLEKRKNLSLLVEAFSLFVKEQPQYKLVLVGQRGPRKTLDDYDDLAHMIEKLALNNKVILTGHVDYSVLQSYYKHAIGYVFPSKNEGFGLPVLEAFAYGLPVLITPQGALMEVGGDAVLIAEANPTALSEKMLLLAQDESLQNTLREAGSQRLKEFTPEKFFISLKDILKKYGN
jgi:glycosyltransferase involved in cell wall biosynthesis